MRKKNFVSLVIGTIGGVLFSIGLCLALLPGWSAFTQGVVIGASGAVALLVMMIVRRKTEGKPMIQIDGRAIAVILVGIIGAIGLGVGMSMSMVWSMMIPGILVGLVGIVLLICLVPICRGLN